MEKGEKYKTTVIHRIRKRVHTTVSPETYEYLKETALNVGQLLDNTVSELRTKIPSKLVLICKSEEENGPGRIRTGDLRRVRATS